VRGLELGVHGEGFLQYGVYGIVFRIKSSGLRAKG
jgi:hypothetical protein